MAITEEGLERIAAAGLKPDQLPRHVAIIMDGNGRWAQRRGLPRIVGHRRGIQSVAPWSRKAADWDLTS